MTIVDLNSVRPQVEILQMIAAKRAQLKELEEQAKAAVQDAMGGHDTGTLDGEIVITWSHFKENRLDTRAFREKYPELAAEFTVTNPKRRFEVK